MVSLVKNNSVGKTATDGAKGQSMSRRPDDQTVEARKPHLMWNLREGTRQPGVYFSGNGLSESPCVLQARV